jgi:LPPG:FO 2-phospho-L-lactate transferase
MDYPKITALAGGVGGAKLVFGLAKILPTEYLHIIVNTGDDFDQYGLHIAPDIDSIVYALAGLSDPVRGFGRAKDTSIVFDTLKSFGEDPWFKLGDKDLALNMKRTKLINDGFSLNEVTKELCNYLGVDNNVIPMTDEKASTRIVTKEFGVLDFQEYFVKHKCNPTVEKIDYSDFEKTHLSTQAKNAIINCDFLIICPSNPWLSIFPILKLTNVEKLILNKKIVAISPIIGTKAVKGPLAKLFYEFGLEPSALGIARLYRDLINLLVLDIQNKNEIYQINEFGIKTFATDIMMVDSNAKIRLASEVINILRNEAI